MSHEENIAKLGSCSSTAELDDVLTTVSTLAVTDFSEEVKKSYYKALELLDPALLSNAKIRRRLKRLQEALFIEGCEDPNSKFIIQLRAVSALADLQTCMDGYKLELAAEGDGYSEEVKASYKLLVETLLDVLKRSEEAGYMNKLMKRRITRLIFVISNQVLGIGPKKAPVEKAAPVPEAKVAVKAKTDKKRSADHMESAVELPAAAPTDEEAAAPKVVEPMESIEGTLAVLKQHASLEAGETKAVLDAAVLNAILDFVIALVKETFDAEPEAAGALTSQKRRLLRRALDRIDIADYPMPKGAGISSGLPAQLHLKHTDVMAFLGSGENAVIKANYGKYYPQDSKGGKKRRKGEAGEQDPPARKYTVFVGQLSYYTTEAMLRKFINQKMGYADTGTEGDAESEGETSSSAAAAFQVRLLTDKVSPEEKKAQEDPRARVSGRRSCRGMAFVDFNTMEEQGKAIKLLHHAPFNGRVINVERTEPKLGKAKKAALALPETEAVGGESTDAAEKEA